MEADKNKLIAETAWNVEGASSASLTLSVDSNAEIVRIVSFTLYLCF